MTWNVLPQPLRAEERCSDSNSCQNYGARFRPVSATHYFVCQEQLARKAIAAVVQEVLNTLSISWMFCKIKCIAYEEMLSHLQRPICTRSQNTPAASYVCRKWGHNTSSYWSLYRMGTQQQQLTVSVGNGNTTPAATDFYRKWGHNASSCWSLYGMGT